jgi:hypothetical protein
VADLTSVANVKGWAGIAGTASDVLLARLVTSASAWITDFTSRSFMQGSATDIRDGTGGTELALPGPVASVQTLTVNTVSIPAQPADGQAGFFLAGDVLCLSGYRFARGRKNVRVTYTAGYATVPAAVEQACIEMVTSAYKRGQRGPDLASRNVSGESHTWALQDMPASVQRVLARYSKVVPL